MGMIQLINGIELPDLCYGSGIVYSYRFDECTKTNAIKYWLKNAIRHPKTFRRDYVVHNVVNVAMRHGCCMFDSSRAYGGSEYIIGKTLRKYNRSDYYISTKLWNKYQYEKQVRKCFEISLKELGTDYVDLYLMHWPVEGVYLDSWKEIERIYEEGLCKAIGVCNCNEHHLKKLGNYANIMPMVNQIECHPLFTQESLREYCHGMGIQIMAYTPTARVDDRLRSTVLVDIAKKYHKSIVQIMLRWHQQIGNIPIVNSKSIKHFVENTNIYDFKLTEEEILLISKININSRLRFDPDNCDFTKL